jgi:hypothetical protein
MLRSITIAGLVAALAGHAAAQAVADAGMDFVLRPTQDPYTDPFGAPAGEATPVNEPAITGALGLPATEPTDQAVAGPPLAGPEEAEPAAPVPDAGPQQTAADRVGPTAAPQPPVQAKTPAPRADEGESFDAPGIQLGTFVIRPAIEIGVEATDNVTGGEQGESAAGVAVAPELTFRQEGSRHELQAEMRGEGIFYGDKEFDERFAEARLFGRYEVTSRTDIQGSLAYTYELDRYTDPNTPDAAVERPAVHDFSGSVAATQRLGRLAATLGGSVERTVHEEVALAGGGTASREELDNTSYGVRVRTAYELSGAMSPYAEAAIGRREYDVQRDSAGFERSSLWGDLRGGLLFDFGSKLSGDVAVGYRREDIDDPRLDDIGGLIAAASLIWSPRRLSEVRFDLSTEVQPTGIPGSPGSLLYAGAVTVSRQVNPRLELEAGGGFSHERFIGVDRREDILTGFAGLSYAFNRTASLEARYVYERTESTDVASATDENRVGVRVRLQR